MNDTKTQDFGVWRMTLSGPSALVDKVGYRSVTVEGFLRDQWDRRNRVFEASRLMALKCFDTEYDDLPDEYCPMTFGIDEVHNEFVTPTFTQAFFVTVYEYDRAYGGPEEGGWWFDTGEPILHVMCGSYTEAVKERDRLQNGPYPATGNSSRVHGGEDYLIRIGVRPGVAFPETHPRYE
jgi:hypothetical protein